MFKKIVLFLFSLMHSGFLCAQSTKQNGSISYNPTQQTKYEKVGTEKIPFVVKMFQPTDAEKKSNDEKETRKDKIEGESKDINARIADYTKALVAIGILQFIVYFYQSKKIKETVDLARQEFLSSHRPRIRIKHVWLHGHLDSNSEGHTPVMVNVVSVNQGETPARVIGLNVVTHAVPKGRHHPNKPFDGRSDVSIAIDDPLVNPLVSGRTLDHHIHKSGDVSWQNVQDIREGKSSLYCFIKIDYLGEFDNVRRQTYGCRIFRPDEGGSMAFLSGAFVKPDHETEYEYAD